MRPSLRMITQKLIGIDMDDSFKGRILVVDDEDSVRFYFETLLTQSGFIVEVAKDLEQMQSRLNDVSYDYVLLDLHLGKEHGLNGLSIVLKHAPFTKVFILTANGTVQNAVDAMQKGASGFIEKGTDWFRILEQLSVVSKEDHRGDSDLSSIGLIGNSPALLEVVEKVIRLREVDSMVLLLGESGTGKEVVARAIHKTSRRSSSRFDAINCGAIPETLLESELFGHARGAFTDAKTSRKGIFELCSSGTLLLDEIGDMPLALQMKLLRVLQEHVVTPVGSSNSVSIDTRVIAATHHDILQDAKEKRFREDLYYRLSIVVLHIPPLRERVEDIPLLTEHFLAMFNTRFGLNIASPCASLYRKMMAYEWPGNIRELQNAMERSVVLSVDGKVSENDLFAHLTFGSKSRASHTVQLQAAGNDSERFLEYSMPLTEAKQDFERKYLEHQLKVSHGQVVAVAERSGRYRADIYRLLSRYGIDHVQYRD